MTDKPHHMTGKRNALKPSEERHTAIIHMRVHPEVKSQYVREASGQGMKLTQWILDACDEKIVREVGNNRTARVD